MVAPPTTIVVKDSQENSVKVTVSYPRLPPKCCNCGRFGHLLNRCPSPVRKKKFGEKEFAKFVPRGTALASTEISLVKEGEIGSDVKTVIDVVEAPQNVSSGSKKTRRRAEAKKRSRVRSRSTPPVEELTRLLKDSIVSAKNQAYVQEWLKEEKERNLAKAAGSQDVLKTWSELVEKGVQDNGLAESASVAQSKQRVALGEECDQKGKSKDLNHGWIASKKLAKFEDKRRFSKKSDGGFLGPSGNLPGKPSVALISSSAQSPRGGSSSKAVSL